MVKDEVIKVEENNKEENETKIPIVNKKTTKISIWRILAYFILYSIIGFVLETIFGLLTKGVIESRKSFLYGPFCAIYGLGAVVMILALQYFKKNNYSLFFGGFFIGSVVEYLISLIGEVIFHVKWWDYSNMAFNIGGRVCIIFSFFWGLLAIYLITHVNPKIDKLIDKIKSKFSLKILKPLTIISIVILIIDFIITMFALKMFFARLVNDYKLDLPNKNAYIEEYNRLYKDENIKRITLKYFSNEKMLKTFPNLKVSDSNGNIIHISDILQEIKPYYFRCFTPRNARF